MIRTLRSLVVSFLALWRGLSQKELSSKTGIAPKRLSYLLKKTDLEDKVYERLLAAVRGRPAHVAVVTACLEGLEELDREDLTPEERDDIALGTLEGARLVRTALIEAARLSRAAPPDDEYPQPEHLEPARWRAGVLFSLLKDLPDEHQLAVVRVSRTYQTWALMERCCEESVAHASRSLERAAFLAHLAQEIAERVKGPEGWCKRVRGYAAGHGPNVLRVVGKLKAAEAGLGEAERLWDAGSDPLGVLDPGRLLDLKGALRRDQRRFDEALSLFDQAALVSRFPGRALVMKGFTLEVMGEYERAIETLLEAESRVDRQADPRLWYKHRSNLSVYYCNVGYYVKAATRLEEARPVASELGDEIDLSRMTWLAGRIAAGLGRLGEARSLLEQARREFATRKMWYDVALALLEIAAFLLDEGRTAEVRTLARDLAKVFESEGVHREALAALKLFQEAAEREAATADLARRVLRFLYRSRYDQGLRFSTS